MPWHTITNLLTVSVYTSMHAFNIYIPVYIYISVNGQYSEEFGVGVGVHQGSVLSPLLFILVLEALSREFRTGVPWELLYADDLVVIADSLEECISKLRV